MTTVTTAQANKLYQVALFTAANRNRSMVNILTEQQDAPKAVSPDKKSTKQTSAGAPGLCESRTSTNRPVMK